MLKAERQRSILELLQQNGNLTVSEIARLFSVSEMTVRRDLQHLDQKGLVRRVHGGAIRDLGRSYEPPYPLRSTEQLAAKQAIGLAAAALVKDGDSIALDIGTPTRQMVSWLVERHNLPIITASLPIANAVVTHLKLEGNVRLVLAGGYCGLASSP